MQIFRTQAAIKDYLRPFLSTQKIGFVPTMGALHEGHLALASEAKKHNDIVVASIFVNPTQFNNANDLAKYPRTEDADAALLQSVGCDVLFAPYAEEMYPQPVRTSLDFGTLETVMEGAFRRGHFNGVGMVVAKLFHIVKPTRAYFGQKDLQQCLVIKQLIQDYSFDIELVIMPTIRETDGLAMSSRNRRLTAAQRQTAPKIYAALQQTAQLLQQGASISSAKEFYRQQIADEPTFSFEYFEIADLVSLATVTDLSKHTEVALCTAVFMDEVRLIDNLIVQLPTQ
jgi:pantoate--beta-alanine ligase